jgi:hypothetical protein
MMPLLTPSDVRSSNLLPHPSSERERDRQERQDLLDENRRLAAEIDRLADENRALREAASIWIRLYEKQLDRANLAQQTARSPRHLVGR